MSLQKTIDCVVIGYNAIDYDQFSVHQKEMYTGNAHEVKTNSLLFNGQRMLYMDLLNHAVEQATGYNPKLNVFNTQSMGACYLQSYLQDRDFTVEVVNFFNRDKDKLSLLLAESPLAVAITTTFYVDHLPIMEIVKFIRERNPETTIIVGGPHIYNVCSDLDEPSQDYIFRQIGADIYVNDSQGETTLSHLLYRLKHAQAIDGVPNLIYFNDDERVSCRTVREPERNDMDDTSIHWETFAPELLTPMTYMRTARSCPFACSFCNYPTQAGAHVLSSLETIEREFDALYKAGTEMIVFTDDTFNVPLPRFKKMMQLMIDKQYGFKWVSFLRCSNLDEHALDLMAESGCVGVFLGVESGDAEMLRKMNKNAKPERYKWGMQGLHERGIATYTSLICGFPGETEETIKNTIAFVEETAPTFYTIQLYYHNRHTPIHAQADEIGLKGGGYNWHHNTMSWREAADWSIYMYKTIQNSIPIPSFEFSMWGIAYLVAQGFTVEQIKQFGRIAQEAFIPSLDDIAIDCTDQERRLVELFKDVSFGDVLEF